MMGPLSRTVLLSLAAAGALATPPALSADIAETQTARRQVALRDAMHELQEARLAYSAKRYSDAVELYRNALSSLPKGPETEKQRKFIEDSLSDALIAKAIDYRSVGRTDEAVEFLQEAIELSPANQRAQVELAHTQDPARTNPALSPQHVGDVEEVSRLLTLAYGQLDLGRYDEAIETFQQVRKYDTYNSAAQRGIEQAQKRRAAYFKAAHDAFHSKALADVDATWEESPDDTSLPPEEIGHENSAVSVAVDSELEESFANAIDKMVMPQIVFEDATIADAIETLQNQILRFEAAGTNATRHINITANFGNEASPAYKELMEKRVNLQLSEVSVRDVLDTLVGQLGITYYFSPTGIELSYSGKDFGPLVERTFVVPPHFFDAREAEEEEEEESDDPFAESSSSVAVRRVNPAQVLKELGISFPEGASARYFPSTRTLHVRNTAYNISEIQDLLNVPLGAERQVVLNVMVMQVSEHDLEELGFDWLVKVAFDGDLFGGGGTSQAASTATGLPAISGVRPEEGDYITDGLRSGSQAIHNSSMDSLIEHGSVHDFSGRTTSKAPGIFSFRGVWNAADVAVIMRGLSQKKGVDIAQNPQMVFTPGMEEQVVVANVREMYYPETYDQGEISTSNFNVGGDAGQVQAVIATGAQPTDFVRFGMTEDEMGGIGTILQVHSAELREDGRYVDLALTTTTTDFEGFINWGTPIKSALWEPVGDVEDMLDVRRNLVEITLSPNYILRPVFKKHLVNTSLTVAPGTVLVFAGLKDAKKVRYEDKVPILGDLPLVGRFFRSEGEENTRKVLLYFAKVDVVDPSGRDVNTGLKPSRVLP